MPELLLEYHPIYPATWAYVSSLLMIGLFFKFSRLWSLRNLDLLLLISFAPGLLMSQYVSGPNGTPTIDDLSVQHLGYLWLFAAGGMLLVRLLWDPTMVRRPLLEPNLSVGGMTFLGVSLFLFLMANVLTSKEDPVALAAARGAEQFFLEPGDLELGNANDREIEEDRETEEEREAKKDREAEKEREDRLARYGPGYPILFQLQRIPAQTIAAMMRNGTPEGEQEKAQARRSVDQTTVRLTAIFSQLAIVLGIVMIGYRHFDNYKTGIAAATLYLMLPYTARMTGFVDHVLPAALLTWALVFYRRPLVAGTLIGLSIGAIYYPIFLLPLWISFYWRRGLFRFLSGVLVAVGVLVIALALEWSDWPDFVDKLRWMFGWRLPWNVPTEGFWSKRFTTPEYRIPVLAAFIAMCGSFALWPAQKNLGTLLCCTAAVMLGSQFWHAHGGGLYMAWFLPIALLTIFRPNLEDRIALAVLPAGWTPDWIAKRSIARAA
ncbi:MAG: hypothetical protein WD875_13860 [Pirellulales bacterium]